jgi:hypothetical protein
MEEFKCPKCGGPHFGRELSPDGTPMSTVRCHGESSAGPGRCDWRGVWPRNSDGVTAVVNRYTIGRSGAFWTGTDGVKTVKADDPEECLLLLLYGDLSTGEREEVMKIKAETQLGDLDHFLPLLAVALARQWKYPANMTVLVLAALRIGLAEVANPKKKKDLEAEARRLGLYAEDN